MKLNSEDLRELYQQETSRRACGGTAHCLTEEMLISVAAGELATSERERVADHFAVCSDCAREYRAIESLRPWTDEVAANNGGVVIPMVVAGNGRQHGELPAMREARLGSRPVPFYLPYAIAAASLILSLALGSLLLSKWRENQRLVAEVKNRQDAEKTETAKALAELREAVDEANRRTQQENEARRVAEAELAKRDAEARSTGRAVSRSAALPEANVPIIDLSPQDAGRGEQSQQATTVQLPPNADLFTLILNLGGADDTSHSYSLEVTDRNNRIVWTSRDLRKSPYNNFTVAMRRRSFPAGEYRFKIYGMRNGRRELLQEYAVRLTY